jgi:hypothetical protein
VSRSHRWVQLLAEPDLSKACRVKMAQYAASQRPGSSPLPRIRAACLGPCLDFTILSQSCCGDKVYLAFLYQNPGIDSHDLRTSASGQLSHYDSVPTYYWFEQIFEKAPRPNHKPYIHLSLIHEEARQSILILRMSSQLRVHDLLEIVFTDVWHSSSGSHSDVHVHVDSLQRMEPAEGALELCQVLERLEFQFSNHAHAGCRHRT